MSSSMSFRVTRIRASNVLTWKSLDMVIPFQSILGIQGGNYSGKSNLVDIIFLACYNRTLRSHTRASLATNGGKDWSTTMDFVSGDRSCVVVRGNRENTLVIDGGLPTVGAVAVNEKMLEILKCPFNQFMNVSYLGQNRLVSLASSTDGDRRNLIEPLMGFPNFGDLKDKSRRDLTRATTDKAVYEERVSSLERRISSIKSSDKSLLESLKSQRGKVRGLVREGQVKFNKVKASVNKAQKLCDDLDDQRTTVQISVQTCLMDINNSEASVEFLNSNNNIRCSTCFSTPNEASLKEARDFFKTKRSLLDDSLALSRLNLKDVRGKLNSSKERLSKVLTEKSDISNEFRENTTKLRRLNYDIGLIEKNSELSQLEVLLSTARKGLVLSEKLISYSRFWVDSLSNKGIPSYLLGGVVKDLSRRVTTYLGDVLPGVKCEFYTSDSGSIKCRIVNRGAVRAFPSCSGAERRLIDLACSFALRDIAEERYGRISDFILLDEIFDSLDESHLQTVQSWLNRLKGCTVLLITHNQGLKDWLPSVKEVRFDSVKGSYFV